MEEIILKLKLEIIEALNLDLTPEKIDNDAPLFGDGLELDSIDALELIVLLEKSYGIKINEAEQAKKIFVSIRVLAEFINSKKK